MQPTPDIHGTCHSYYGTWNVKDNPPKLGVVYFMLDEHVKKIVDKEKERFEQEMLLVMDKFAKSFKEISKKNSVEIKAVQFCVNELTKYMYKIVDVNKLKEPEITKKGKKKPKPKLKVVDDDIDNEDDLAEGYL